MPIILQSVPIERPEGTNVILGQAHFIKSVEDVHEALVNAVPRIAFGLAFCEASGPCLVRTSGTDEALVELAGRDAIAIGAGHSFLILLKDRYPVNVLPAIRQVPETCTIFCASAIASGPARTTTSSCAPRRRSPTSGRRRWAR